MWDCTHDLNPRDCVLCTNFRRIKRGSRYCTSGPDPFPPNIDLQVPLKCKTLTVCQGNDPSLDPSRSSDGGTDCRGISTVIDIVENVKATQKMFTPHQAASSSILLTHDWKYNQGVKRRESRHVRQHPNAFNLGFCLHELWWSTILQPLDILLEIFGQLGPTDLLGTKRPHLEVSFCLLPYF
jgi:hypothetical protein